MAIPSLLIVFLISAVADALGFIKFSYFVSFGYNLSVVANCIAFLIMFRNNLTIFTIALSVLLIVYALRLGIYIFIRESRSNSFREKMKGEHSNGANMNFFAKCAMWIAVAAIYACQVTPIYYRLNNGTPDNVMLYVGFGIALIGFIFEAIGDQQKYNAKKANPTTFVSNGLYKMVRCPNYLGELLLWTGVFISGITSYSSLWQWIISATGYICIASVMISAARTLEVRQNKSYGNDERYQEYVRKTPILIPLIPFYTFGGSA